MPTVKSTRHRQRAAGLLAALGALGGCATSGAGSSPAEVTRAQIAALTAGDEAGAAALLAREVQVKAPQWPAPSALPDAASVHEVERTAVWSGARELELVRGPHGWTMRRGVLGLFRLDSPEGALTALARAIEARDVGLLLALMPDESRRQQVPGALERALSVRAAAWTALARAIDGGRLTWVSREAARAEVRIAVGARDGGGDEGHRVVLALEDGGWKVFDVRPWSEYTAP